MQRTPTTKESFNLATGLPAKRLVWLKGAGQDDVLKDEDFECLQAQYAVAKPLWVKVSILRNNVYGHRALDLDIEEAFEKAGVTPNDFRDLVAQTKALLNELTLKVRNSAHAFNLSATQDTLNLLDTLKAE